MDRSELHGKEVEGSTSKENRRSRSIVRNPWKKKRFLGHSVKPWRPSRVEMGIQGPSDRMSGDNANILSKPAGQKKQKTLKSKSHKKNKKSVGSQILLEESQPQAVAEPPDPLLGPLSVDSKRISFTDSSDAIKKFLKNRPTMGEVKVRGILRDPERESKFRREREQAKTRLSQRLSRRPSQYELFEKGILLG
jgi:hypothetical protein